MQFKSLNNYGIMIFVDEFKIFIEFFFKLHPTFTM